MGYSFDDCGDESSCKDQEIAEKLGRHVKSIDNALQRVKRKLEKSLDLKPGQLF